MSHIDFLLERLRAAAEAPCLVWNDHAISFGELLAERDRLHGELEALCLPAGAVVGLEADFSPRATALLLALIERNAVIVPIASAVTGRAVAAMPTPLLEWRVRLDAGDHAIIEQTGDRARHELLDVLRERAHPGLVFFSSGSTGRSKAILHDVVPLLEKFRVPRHSLRTIGFLMFDHIGGFNTLLYSLGNGGCIVALRDRRPQAVCRAIEHHRAQLLPTSPTFLNLLLASKAHEPRDLSSLKLVTYGTEVMPQSTLARFREAFPHVELLQTYGLSELGILRSKSLSCDSLWVRLGGEGCELRVADGLLEIKSRSAMLGYLNHASPFTADGWLRTGDAVEVQGEYLRILGRKSEIINVGGEKVYPAQVENVLQAMSGVDEVVVRGEPHALVGQIVCARVRLAAVEDLAAFRARLRRFCSDKLPQFAIPQKVEIAAAALHDDRYKKTRVPLDGLAGQRQPA